MHHTPLTDGWTITPTGGPVPDAITTAGPVPATVPGSVHTDLLALDLIPDPYLDAHEDDLRWFHHTDWRYTRDLTLDPPAPGERIDLAFDGIDTVGTVGYAGAELLRTANMHRSYRVDVRHLADGTAHPLTVDLRSATAYAHELREQLGDRPNSYWPVPFNFVRKMACSFGWDWGPDLRTVGLWKQVRIERWHTARLAEVRPLITVDDDGTGRVEVHVTVERSGLVDAAPLPVSAEVCGVRVEGEITDEHTVLHLAVPDADLWWPVGYGDHPLHTLTVTLGDGLDSWTRQIGFRNVRLDLTDGFVLHVNGRPIAVKGANWIPDDHFLTRITRERLDRRLDQALGARLNLLRIWGGGVYESEDFYAACDERGLLVWQDFLLACAAYPEEQPLAAEFEAEARENVVRLAPHPSLVIWNGGNENLWGYQDWGWQQLLGDATWGEHYAVELFRDIVAELDPTRPYTDNSPFTPGRADLHPNDPDHGSHHQWEVWNRVDYREYRSETPRFCSEFGFQGPPTWRTLTDWVHTGDDPKTDPVFLIHQKADDGNGKLDRGLAPHLGIPADFTDWHWATQLNQARAVEYAVTHYRGHWPHTAGWIVWQLNDCWPVTSWAAVDSEERRKPLWYALRNAGADRLLTVLDSDAVLVNDTDRPWTGDLHLRRQRHDGTVLAEDVHPVEVAPRAVTRLPIPAPTDPRTEILVAELTGVRHLHVHVEDIDSTLDPDPVTATATRIDGGYRVEVTAHSTARDVTLLPDRLAADAVVDEALVDLAAGDSVTFTVRTTAELDPAALTRSPVLRTANDLRSVATTHSPDQGPLVQTAPVPISHDVEATA